MPSRRSAASMCRLYRLPPVRRAGSPAVTSATSGVVEHHLDRLGGAAVEERIRLSRARERDAMGDELREGQLPEQLRRQLEAPLAVPTWRERGIDPADLRAHQAHAAAVEAAAEVEWHRLLAVPRADDHGALRRDAVDRLLERSGTAACVDRDVGAAASGER